VSAPSQVAIDGSFHHYTFWSVNIGIMTLHGYPSAIN
jgi:hypothetical protein